MKNNKNENGFTLVEALVAIFILVVGVTGVVSLISQSIKGFSASGERLVASNLAQEGIEVIHNIRDNNWLKNVAWNDWTGDGVADSCSPCTGNVLWNSVNFTSGGGLDLKWNGSRYDSDGSGDVYYRIIAITDLGDLSSPADGTNDYASVKSTVGWGPSGSCTASSITVPYKYCLTLEERLYDWR